MWHFLHVISATVSILFTPAGAAFSYEKPASAQVELIPATSGSVPR